MRKKVAKSTITGEQGIALIHRRVLEMGFVWHQRSVDAGIDGEIELRDPVSEAALNRFILVQSKASDRLFPGETQDAFHYVCSDRDIEYWLSGNAPVILVCSHPASQEAWWVSLKEWFSDPARRTARRVDFDKRTQRFDKASAQALMHLAVPAGSGLYLRPPPRPERLAQSGALCPGDLLRSHRVPIAAGSVCSTEGARASSRRLVVARSPRLRAASTR
jgi:hypothetical protein